MKLKEICSFLGNAIPLSFQESYDNSGLQCGDPESDVRSALLAIDVTREVIDEAVSTGSNLVICHHPLLFRPLKSITGNNDIEKILITAIRNDISIYAAHTNLDAFENGVSLKMAEKLRLKNVKPLVQLKGIVSKLVTFVPEPHLEKVRSAVFEAGAGVIGNYDNCGFISKGTGSFRGGENTNPFAGEKGIIHFENEIRFETVFLSQLKGEVLSALLKSHPYEEPAYDIYSLDNSYPKAGMGACGEMENSIDEAEFLKLLGSVFGAEGIRYSKLTGRKIRKVAMCGGAGISLLQDAIAAKSDVFVTGDVKYHDFFNAEGRILIADIGHYESEKYSTEILYDLIIKKFPTFALRFSEINTNPINYL